VKPKKQHETASRIISAGAQHSIEQHSIEQHSIEQHSPMPQVMQSLAAVNMICAGMPAEGAPAAAADPAVHSTIPADTSCTMALVAIPPEPWAPSHHTVAQADIEKTCMACILLSQHNR
jgi:hypothetical protein